MRGIGIMTLTLTSKKYNKFLLGIFVYNDIISSSFEIPHRHQSSSAQASFFGRILIGEYTVLCNHTYFGVSIEFPQHRMLCSQSGQRTARLDISPRVAIFYFYYGSIIFDSLGFQNNSSQSGRIGRS